MPKLKDNPKLEDFQNYIREMCEERGWDDNTHLQKFLLFSEEVGELAKAIRHYEGLHVESEEKKKRFELEEEFADCFNYLLDLANGFDVDLEKAFREKNEINETRSWKSGN